jgi:hypothetical protein
MSAILKILMPTDEEEAQINAGISSNPNSFTILKHFSNTLGV